jgi:hypothetical protein
MIVALVLLKMFLHPMAMANIAKGLQAADDLTIRVVKRRCIDQQMDHLVTRVPSFDSYVLIGVPTRESSINRTVLTAKNRPKNLSTFSPYDLLPVEPGDPFCRPIPGNYFPVFVNGHDTFGNAVENCLEELGVFHVSLHVLAGRGSHGVAGIAVRRRTGSKKG